MITNLLASLVVTLVTNITTSDNAVYEQIQNPCPDKMVGCCVFHGYRNGPLIKPATEKTEIAVVKEITSAEFNWGAEKKTFPLSEKIISTTATVYRKIEDWKYVSRADVEPPKLLTNSIRGGMSYLFFTNLVENIRIVASITNINIK